MSGKPGKGTARLRIDGRSFEVDPARNLLEVALEKGFDLPYFCWHPSLGSVGACRQCAVTQYADDKDEHGRVVMACMTPCTDGSRFAIDEAQAREMRQSVIELLMTNHPHDCPVCEEGGNCHLQDMTVMTGQSYRRYRHAKRTHRNQDLGPFVSHEMNRCIACYRCVRYYRDYAGGDDLNVFGAHNDVFFGRAEDGTLENEFSGNLVEVCPTGVFTDRPYGESYTRKWDLSQAPGVCAHCSIGCNVMPGERYGRIKRIENRYHGQINGYFLCDRGRYGYAYTNDAARLTQSLARDDTPSSLSALEAVERLEGLLREGGVAAVGSTRAALETNYALRELVGADNFYRGQSDADAALDDAGVALLRSPTTAIAGIADVENADAALVLGEDVLQTGARVALALRQMTRNRSFEMARRAHVPVWQDQSVRLVAQDERSPLHIASPSASPLDEIAASTLRGTAAGLARFGFAVAHALDDSVPAPGRLPKAQTDAAATVAKDLIEAENPLLVTGTGCADVRVLAASAAIAKAYHKRRGRPLAVSVIFSACNSVGTSLIGGPGCDALIQREGIKTLIVAETDLYRCLPGHWVHSLRKAVDNLVVIDGLDTATSQQASLQLATGTVFESDGTLVNFEGRAQRHFQVFTPGEDIAEPWRWLQAAASAIDRDLGDGLDDLTAACAAAIPALARITEAAPDADFRIAGQRVPRQSHRYSGRTAMAADRDIHEAQPPADADSALAFSMEGAVSPVAKPGALTPIFWAPRWNSIQSVNKFQEELGGALRGGDPGVCLLEGGDAEGPAIGKPPGAPAKPVATPLWHLFGSEELSGAAEPIRQRGIPEPYLALHPEAAGKLGLEDGDRAVVNIDELSISVVVRLRDDIDTRAAGLPHGLPGMPPIPWGQTVEVERRAD